jgi:predicted DNA-binding transcriptional regulator YafY
LADRRTERLLNLVLCLMSTSQALPRESLRTLVEGYPENATDVAFQRMFERDKDDLRGMGIPIRTVTLPSGEVLGYTITGEDYRLDPVDFTSEQILLLNLAARAWSQATLGQGAQSALRKIESQWDTAQPPAQELRLDLRARPTAGDLAIPVLWEALATRREISFAYRGIHDQTALNRRVQAWGVLHRDGGWYLVGHDLDRADVRVFRTSRMQGIPTICPAANTYTIPDVSISDLVTVHGSTESQPQMCRAELLVAGNTGARLRQMAASIEFAPDADDVPPGWDRLVVNASDYAMLVSAVASLGADVSVVSPLSLRHDVRERWQRALARHEDHRPTEDHGSTTDTRMSA